MAEVYWIKLHTSTFDSETVMLLESLPEGDTILVIWFKIQILAGKCNAGGYLLLNGECPYSDEMLATVFRRPLNTVRLAISAFLRFKMVEIINGAYFLPDWPKTQNVKGLDDIREQTRKRVARFRSKPKDFKDLNKCNVTSNAPVTQCNKKETELKKEKKKQQQPGNEVVPSLVSLVKDAYRTVQVLDAVKSFTVTHGEEYVTSNIRYSNAHAKRNYCKFLCDSLSHDWAANDRAGAAVQRATQKTKTTEQACVDVETKAKNELWETLKESERECYRREVRASLPSNLPTPLVAIEETAKLLVWELKERR